MKQCLVSTTRERQLSSTLYQNVNRENNEKINPHGFNLGRVSDVYQAYHAPQGNPAGGRSSPVA